MAINLPPDKLTNPAPGKAADAAAAKVRAGEVSSATEAAKEQRSALVKAVVAEVQAKLASSSFNKPVYDAIIQLNPREPGAGSIPKPVTELSNEVIRQINAGKPVAVRVETTAPLKAGQQLQVQQQGVGLKLVSASAPSLPTAIQQLVRQEINQQNSYAQLLSSLQSIVKSQTSPPLNNPSAATTNTQNPDQQAPQPQSPAVKSGLQPGQMEGNVTRQNAALIKTATQQGSAPGEQVNSSQRSATDTPKGTQFAKTVIDAQSTPTNKQGGNSEVATENKPLPVNAAKTGFGKTANPVGEKVVPGKAIPSASSSQAARITNTESKPSTQQTPQSPQPTQTSLDATKLPVNTVKQLTKLVQDFITSLPTKDQTTSAQGLKEAIRNSGIFYEKQLFAGKTIPGAVPEKGNNLPKSVELIQQVRQQIKAVQAALQENTNKSTHMGTRDGKPVLTSATDAPPQPLLKDLKYNLLNLEKQLRQLQANQAANFTKGDQANTKLSENLPLTEKAAKDSLTNDKALNPGNANKGNAKVDNINPANKGLELPVKGAEKGTRLGQAPISPDKLAHLTPEQRAAARAAEAKHNSPIYHRPTATASGQTSTPNQQPDGGESHIKSPTELPDLTHPPLPGRINIQAQSIRPRLMSKDSLADALISVLIKQTKEATSRVNLHQLTSMADMSRTDAGQQQPTALSFELPILQGNELSLFQFRLFEETEDGAKKESADGKEKKWVVHMGFDLEGLGPMYCQITLIGVGASVTFWAEEKATVSRSRRYLDSLSKNLHKLGVVVKEIQCVEGSPPHDQSGIKQSLIDIET